MSKSGVWKLQPFEFFSRFLCSER